MTLGRVAVAPGLLNLALLLVLVARGGSAGAGTAGVLRPATGPAAPEPADVAQCVLRPGAAPAGPVCYTPKPNAI